jgi:hypothetical protein
MRMLFVLLVVTLLSVGVVACGKTSNGAVSSTHSNTTATGSDTATSVSTSTSQSSTKGGGFRTSEPGPYESGGVVASAADRREVTAVVKRYYAAVATDDGAEACQLLYPPLGKSIAEDYGNSAKPLYMRGNTCAVVMSKLFRHRRGRPTSDVAGIEVTGVRILNGIAAVALLRSPTMRLGETSLHREGATWTVEQMLGGSLN